MSNYKSALGVGIELVDLGGEPGELCVPSNADGANSVWWYKHLENMTKRYDVPEFEKWRHKFHVLPVAFHLRGVHSLAACGKRAASNPEAERAMLLRNGPKVPISGIASDKLSALLRGALEEVRAVIVKMKEACKKRTSADKVMEASNALYDEGGWDITATDDECNKFMKDICGYTNGEQALIRKGDGLWKRIFNHLQRIDLTQADLDALFDNDIYGKILACIDKEIACVNRGDIPYSRLCGYIHTFEIHEFAIGLTSELFTGVVGQAGFNWEVLEQNMNDAYLEAVKGEGSAERLEQSTADAEYSMEDHLYLLSCPLFDWSDYDYRSFWTYYGGDYWLYYVWKNRDVRGRSFAFWKTLHQAGTRGVFVLEVGSERGVRFTDPSGKEIRHEIAWNNGLWSGWYLIVADLRGSQVELFEVYDDPQYLAQLQQRFELQWDESWRRLKAPEGAKNPQASDLYLHHRYKEKLIRYALCYPQEVSTDERGLPTELQQKMCDKALQVDNCRHLSSITAAVVEGYTYNQLRLFGCDRLQDLGTDIIADTITELSLTWALSLTDISAVAGCKQLKKLRLHRAEILEDLSPLLACTKLQELDVEGCTHIHELELISSLSSLKVLNIKSTGVRDLRPLARLPKLKTIHVNKADIEHWGELLSKCVMADTAEQ